MTKEDLDKINALLKTRGPWLKISDVQEALNLRGKAEDVFKKLEDELPAGYYTSQMSDGSYVLRMLSLAEWERDILCKIARANLGEGRAFKIPERKHSFLHWVKVLQKMVKDGQIIKRKDGSYDISDEQYEQWKSDIWTVLEYKGTASLSHLARLVKLDKDIIRFVLDYPLKLGAVLRDKKGRYRMNFDF